MDEKYTDVVIDDKTKYRLFKDTIDGRELLWHHDKKDRTIHIFSGVGWKLQMDDELPMLLEEGKDYFIPNHIFHRVIKGKGDLIIKITET